MISSYTRMSYSVVVLMLEATNSFNLVIPMIVAVFMSRSVADLFTSSIFKYEVREKQMPILTGSCPAKSANLKAY